MQRVLIYYLSPILTLPCFNNMHCCGIRLWRSNFSFGLWILFYIFLILFYFKLYIIVLVLPNIKMNPPQVYMCSPSWTLLPSPSSYHTSGLSQCTSPKHPVSCIEPGLVTRFIHDILDVSMPFSQIFPPSPSPTESIRLLYTVYQCLLCCLVHRVIVTIFLNSIYVH